MQCCTYRWKNFTYYYGFFSCSCARFCSIVSFVLCSHTYIHKAHSSAVYISLTLSISVAFSMFLFLFHSLNLIFVCNSSLMIRHAEIHLVRNGQKKNPTLSNEQASKSARTELRSSFLCFFLSYSNEMRGS